eukprot:c20623_g2_i1 orf=117-296(+)
MVLDPFIEGLSSCYEHGVTNSFTQLEANVFISLRYIKFVGHVLHLLHTAICRHSQQDGA